MSTLFELKGDYLRITDLIADPEIDEQVILDTWEAIEGEFNIKAENYAKLCKNLEAQVKSLKDMELELAKKRKTLEAREASLKRFMFTTMKDLDIKEAGGDIFKIKICKNGGKVPVVLDCEPDELPVMLQRVRVEANMEAVRQYLEEGNEGFAHFGEQGESLRIR